MLFTYNMVVAEGLHSFNVPVAYNIVDRLTIKAGPGLSFDKHDGHYEFHLSAHVETIYEFEFDHFHIGPMIGMGYDREGAHFGFGIHAGMGI